MLGWEGSIDSEPHIREAVASGSKTSNTSHSIRPTNSHEVASLKGGCPGLPMFYGLQSQTKRLVMAFCPRYVCMELGSILATEMLAAIN